MTSRNPLKNRLFKAWDESISRDYHKQRINSERSLQASYWAQLNSILPETQRVFIEPPMRMWTKYGWKKVIPDILVCSKTEVIAVIELKFSPKGQPDYQKDIETMALISRKRTQVLVSNKRFRGNEVDSREYSLSRNILFVWAGIHAKPKKEIQKLYASRYKSLDNAYVQFHAETAHDQNPLVYLYE